MTLTPAGDGRLEVEIDGQWGFDRIAEDGIYPELDRVREWIKLLREKLQAIAAA